MPGGNNSTTTKQEPNDATNNLELNKNGKEETNNNHKTDNLKNPNNNINNQTKQPENANNSQDNTQINKNGNFEQVNNNNDNDNNNTNDPKKDTTKNVPWLCNIFGCNGDTDTKEQKLSSKTENIDEKNIEEPKYYDIKVFVIGDSSVGKSELINTFINPGQQNFGMCLPTIGIKTHEKTVKLLEKQFFRFFIYEFPGGQKDKEETFKSYNNYHEINSVIMIYDITNQNSLDNCNIWMNQLLAQENCPTDQNLNRILIGTKSDLTEERQVSDEMGQEQAKENGSIPFFEISAKDEISVDKLFINLAEMQVKKEFD